MQDLQKLVLEGRERLVLKSLFRPLVIAHARNEPPITMD